jgi:hypothetical protein
MYRFQMKSYFLLLTKNKKLLTKPVTGVVDNTS